MRKEHPQMNDKEPRLSQEQIYQRLARLDEETQERISQKYYHGTKPWLKRGESLRRRRRRVEKPQE